MRKKVLSVRLSPEIEEKVKALAKSKNVSVSSIVEQAIALLLSFTPFLDAHHPDRPGIHHYLFLADEEERKHTKKPLVLSFVQNKKIPEDISPEELRELEEDLEERLYPGKVIGSMWKDMYETPEEALANIAHILAQEMGFSPERFTEEFSRLQESLFFEEDTGFAQEGPLLFGILKGDEDILSFLKAKEKDITEGTREFVKLLKTLSRFKIVIHDKNGAIVKTGRFSSLEDAEKAILKEGYSREDIEYSLAYEEKE